MFYQKLYGIAMNYAQKSAQSKGQNVKKAQPGELIYAVPLSAAKSDYEINLATENGVSSIPIENRLAFRNNFIVSAMALGVLKVTTDSGNLLWGADHPVFWEDPNIFSIAAGGADLSESQAVAGIWNGHVTLEGNEENKIVKLPLRGFRTIQQTQRATILTTDGADPGSHQTFNMQDGSEYKSLGGIVKLGGGNENKLLVHVECQDKTHLPGDSSGTNYLYIALRGAFIRGGTIAELQG